MSRDCDFYGCGNGAYYASGNRHVRFGVAVFEGIGACAIHASWLLDEMLAPGFDIERLSVWVTRAGEW